MILAWTGCYLQCDPGDLFVVRNVANIVLHLKDEAASWYQCCIRIGIRFLKVKHLIY